MKKILFVAALFFYSGAAVATDITWDDKVTGGSFTADDANAIKTAVNSKADKAAALVGDCTVGPCLDGSTDGGNLIKLWAGTGSYWTALQGGAPAANRSWRLPIDAPPSAGETNVMTMDEYGQMGFLDKPSTSGYVLSSTDAGVLSWIANGAGAMVYPGAGLAVSTGSAWGTSITLGTGVATALAAAVDGTGGLASYSALQALPVITWGAGLTDTDDTISVTYPVTSEAFSGSGWNGDTDGAQRNDIYDHLHIGDTDDDGKADALDTAVVIPDTGTLTFDESSADPNDADIQLSATDGVFKIAAVNGENNEDLTIDLDSASNKAKFNSGSGLVLITTGSMPFTGAIRTVGKSSDYTIGTDDADEAYGAFFVNTGASTRTFTLPSAVAGMSVCVRNGQGVSQILRLDANTGDYIVKSTGARTSAAAEYYGATADAKNQLCVVAYDETDWYVTSEVGTWTEE